MQEAEVQFLGWEDPQEKEVAIHSQVATLAWEILWTEAWRATVHAVAKESYPN